ncbi:hypothetical protein M8J75_013162 [Diaphorina citri]|nr:hypothetical protein M8J75_013162 [Diaphorina citri]
MSKSNMQSLQINVEVMLNNKEYSDTVFLVNNNQFYASSHLVSVSSKPFKFLLTDHFNNCADKIIKISNVKHDDSFHIILKCIYGIEINFTQTDKAVLCEVLCLCDTYELTHFSKDIQWYLSKLESFQIDSVVVLLNTAKKFNLMDLYKRLSIFAYQNTDQLVKHISFVNLQFDVLVDLIQSDWFCTLEIDILTGVLNWHNDMVKSGRGNDQETWEKKSDGECSIEHHDSSSNNHSDASSSATDLAENVEEIEKLCPDDNDGIVKENGNENSELEEECKESSKNNSREKILNNGMPHEADISSELVKTFSANVLKSLLSHIRISSISATDFMKASETKLFAMYKEFLSDCKQYSQIIQPRMGEVGEVSKSNVQSLQKNVGVMLNNKEFSDTVFLVNTSQFYASSHLVSVSSKPFKSLLTDHFNNCADKIIKISNVKHDDSFHIILKCIYGIEINFTQTDKAVLCEVLCLCDTYELTHFSKDIQWYLSKLESFQIDSVVVLLNTAKKFNLMDLYKRLSIFAYQNTDQLVKHTSFVNLQFDVLVDLIQSDWFCTLEIDILTGVLNWHNDMAKSGRRNDQETCEKKNESADAIEQHNAGASKGSNVSSDTTDLAVYDTADMFHSEEVYPRNESSRMVEKHAEFSGNNSSGKTLDNALETKGADKSTDFCSHCCIIFSIIYSSCRFIYYIFCYCCFYLSHINLFIFHTSCAFYCSHNYFIFDVLYRSCSFSLVSIDYFCCCYNSVISLHSFYCSHNYFIFDVLYRSCSFLSVFIGYFCCYNSLISLHSLYCSYNYFIFDVLYRSCSFLSVFIGYFFCCYCYSQLFFFTVLF